MTTDDGFDTGSSMISDGLSSILGDDSDVDYSATPLADDSDLSTSTMEEYLNNEAIDINPDNLADTESPNLSDDDAPIVLDDAAYIDVDGHDADITATIDDADIDNTDDYSEVKLEDDNVYGSAHQWNHDWFFQQGDGYCGPTSVAIIVNEFFDAGISDPDFMVSKAYELGLTDDISKGMYMADVNTLLEASGVPCENVHSSMDDLAQRLEDGYGVIAFVDSGELWGTTSDQVAEDNTPDHFLVVTEIDYNTGTVTLADPGDPNGNSANITIAEFEDAWADSNYEMVATTVADQDVASAAMGSATHPSLAVVNATGSDVIR